MANIRLIKGRIKSAKNISQITKAMELVAAAKMKKAQQQAIAGKLYAQKIHEMVITLSSRVVTSEHPFLRKTNALTGRKLIILLSSNKGLCGGLNTGLFRFFLNEYPKTSNFECVTLGKKGASFLAQTGSTLKADFSTVTPLISAVPALTELVVREFTTGAVDAVELVYNDFISIMKQTPKKKTILPLTIDALPVQSEAVTLPFHIEPNIDQVFEALLPHYLENQIRDAVLEAEASEHSARMVAMRSATDNALSLVDDLTLVYNKARQEKITYEITDLITARLAVA